MVKSELLTTEQITELVVATVKGSNNPNGNDYEKVVQWAERTITNYALLQNVLMGNLLVKVDKDGCLSFWRSN